MNLVNLHKRAAIIRAVRFFFDQQGYLELETPIRQKVFIPEANIVPVSSGSHFLQTSPELAMKRFLAQSGVKKIFQICKCFRADERGRRHLPEFTMLEWYQVGGDYQSLMREVVELFAAIVKQLAGSALMATKVIELISGPWQYLTVAEAFNLYGPMAVEQALAQDLFDEILVEKIEPNLGILAPCFLYDYPRSLASLARAKDGQENIAERFELYVNGLELANGFSELVDPVEQRQRFALEIKEARERGLGEWSMPLDFLMDLAKLPATCGIALGVDRLVMVLLGVTDIGEVVAVTSEP